MEQFLDLKIIECLLKKENYIRELAKILQCNHMSILRKVNFLAKENVLDFKREGKNKVFFLKKSCESRNFIFIAEFFKNFCVLKKYSELRFVFDKIQKNNQVGLAVLFGSYAKFCAKKDSDIDVYIETDNKKVKQDLEKIDSKLSVKIGFYNKENLLIKEIKKNHVIIKGVELFYEKNEFFK